LDDAQRRSAPSPERRLYFTKAGTTSGSLFVQSGARVDFYRQTFEASSSVTGGGTWLEAFGAATVRGTYDVAGQTYVQNAVLTSTPAAGR